jgi:uncharacterized protein Yka (UPF0111/DUF47 family)
MTQQSDAPATKADIETLRNELRSYFATKEDAANIRTDITRLEGKIDSVSLKLENKLLSTMITGGLGLIGTVVSVGLLITRFVP